MKHENTKLNYNIPKRSLRLVVNNEGVNADHLVRTLKANGYNVRSIGTQILVIESANL